MEHQSCKWNIGEWSSNQGTRKKKWNQGCTTWGIPSIPLWWERQKSHPTNFGKMAAKKSRRDGKGKENEERETKQSTYIANTTVIEREEWSKKAQGNNPGKVLQLFKKVFVCYQNVYHGLQDGTIQDNKILKAINLISRKKISPTIRRSNFVTGQKYIVEKVISCHWKDV